MRAPQSPMVAPLGLEGSHCSSEVTVHSGSGLPLGPENEDGLSLLPRDEEGEDLPIVSFGRLYSNLPYVTEYYTLLKVQNYFFFST